MKWSTKRQVQHRLTDGAGKGPKPGNSAQICVIGGKGAGKVGTALIQGRYSGAGMAEAMIRARALVLPLQGRPGPLTAISAAAGCGWDSAS